MPIKGTGRGTDLREIDRWDGGVGWMAHPDETMRRASHALVADGTDDGSPDSDTDAGSTDDGTGSRSTTDGGEVWVVEPVDAAGLDDLLAELGDVAGVVVLADYHRRDAAAVAARHDVAVSVPAWLDRVPRALDVPVERFSGELAGTGYRLLRVADDPLWVEGALYHPGEGTLVCTETLVTADHLTAPGERLAVTPFRRLWPPRAALGGLDVGRVLVGHGEGVHADADEALSAALAGARRRAPSYFLRNTPTLARTTYVAVRD